jgi:Ca2+:H+ antiporter
MTKRGREVERRAVGATTMRKLTEMSSTRSRIVRTYVYPFLHHPVVPHCLMCLLHQAINVEHPFGLPIWKPALYKKSRSITRNAETALHATPSFTALRHLAPGNILWTLFFGSWLALVCVIVSGVLWCVPWGGGKYGRVIWELGGYLVWPFGKYVEGWTDGEDGDDGEDDDDDDDDDDEEEADGEGYDNLVEDDEGEEQEEELMEGGGAARQHDLEDAGRTYGRGRVSTVGDRSTSTPLAPPRSRISGVWDNDGEQANLPDEPGRTNLAVRGVPGQAPPKKQDEGERSSLLSGRPQGYGTTTEEEDKNRRSPSEETAVTWRPHDFSKDDNGNHSFRVRALGRTMYWVGFYLVVAPLMLLVCILCWGMVFTIPMAKLLWVLLRHLSNEPLSLHFRSPPKYTSPPSSSHSTSTTAVDGIQYPLRAGQRAPRVSRKSVDAAKRNGRLFGPKSTVLLCTYRAAGLEYYKYTIDGVNIIFINLLSLVFFVIADFFWLEQHVEKHQLGGLLAIVASQAFIFVIALLSVIPLSYFIGMAVASISAQSSIGMGAVINASFGSIIEIILYCIALTQAKGELVEGSIIGSILAGVLLMPGLSMIGGAMRRKEQKFNAKSAGVTSTMLIMAIIGILTPTMFYEIYGSVCFLFGPAVSSR